MQFLWYLTQRRCSKTHKTDHACCFTISTSRAKSKSVVCLPIFFAMLFHQPSVKIWVSTVPRPRRVECTTVEFFFLFWDFSLSPGALSRNPLVVDKRKSKNKLFLIVPLWLESRLQIRKEEHNRCSAALFPNSRKFSLACFVQLTFTKDFTTNSPRIHEVCFPRQYLIHPLHRRMPGHRSTSSYGRVVCCEEIIFSPFASSVRPFLFLAKKLQASLPLRLSPPSMLVTALTSARSKMEPAARKIIIHQSYLIACSLCDGGFVSPGLTRKDVAKLCFIAAASWKESSPMKCATRLFLTAVIM